MIIIRMMMIMIRLIITIRLFPYLEKVKEKEFSSVKIWQNVSSFGE